jgi:phosphatidylserine decarboxylase
MIKFGSRTDVIVPLGQATATVRKGDRVLAGITPIARYL